ncbi:MAG TPA: IS1595 family transposase [bacterium]|nr:IS1595 family transposase [bacterium]HOL48446.1 IS1595 family transposase [bacterium]HPQ19746.1 IS1595 family transposase [bacterium]
MGIKNYKTALLILQKLRQTMVRKDRELLKDVVEIIETYIGGKKSGKQGRVAGGKKLVIIAVEKKYKKSGHIRLKKIKNASQKVLNEFILNNVEKGSTIITDCWSGYNEIISYGYKHERVIGYVGNYEEILPTVHKVASLLKRWILGTPQGAIRNQLNYYLDEFVFRFNRRTSKNRGNLFIRLLEQALKTKTITYKNIIKYGENKIGGVK